MDIQDGVFSSEQLLAFAEHVFLTLGFSDDDAKIASKNLISADLRGIDSHGIARLSGYVRLIEVGRINPKAKIVIHEKTPTTTVVDADKGLGLVVATKAMQIAIDKATIYGSGWVSVRNSSHFGIAGQHALQAVNQDMIGIAMTNASALVAPTFSKSRMLGTNPIAVGIPAGQEPAFLADLATTTAANGKLEILQRKNLDTPSGWIQDKDGNETRNAHGLKDGGALLPLGSDVVHGSHKGYALGSVVDIFSAVFSGANYGPWVPPFPAYVPIPENPVGEGIGHFFGAMRIDAWRSKEEFKSEMDNWIRTFKAAERIDESLPVLIPGEPERICEVHRLQHGIPLHDIVIKDLIELGKRYDVKF
jgi:LDH2 family malate/lactate/ureidoglycolate dehydrogenase